MTTTHKHQKVESRNEKFTDRTATKIWCETPSDDNPYIASRALCHGYDLIELMQNRSFVDVFYLLFRGELPSVEDSRLLEQLMIGLINPGPRHPATRAAMNAGVGKTNPVHILPIAASVLGGNYLGGGEIEQAIRFFRKHLKKKNLRTSQISCWTVSCKTVAKIVKKIQNQLRLVSASVLAELTYSQTSWRSNLN